MVPKGPLLDRPHLSHGRLRLQIFAMRLQRDAVHAEYFKGIGKLQQLRFGIQSGTVILRCKPCVPDLHCSVLQVEIKKARGSMTRFSAFSTVAHGMEAASRPRLQRRIHPVPQIIRRLNRR